MQRLGVIVPSSNTTVEEEFSAVLHGSDVSLHIARIPLSSVTVEELSKMEKETKNAAQLLKDADVDLTVFACTSGSLIKGLGHDEALAKSITQVTGRPAVVTAGAVVEAFEKLRAQRIALATPYTEEITRKEIEFLKANGFEVAKAECLNIVENLKIGRLNSRVAAALAKKADSNDADAVFISCTNFRTLEVIPQLEEQLRKPVVSSNSATLWASLKVLKANFHVCLGSLFET